MSINKAKDHYIEKLAETFRTNFEEKTGKKMGTGAYFDMTEVINHYGVIIEFDDLYEGKYKLDSYICKIEEDGFDFKIVIDNEKAKKLKTVDEKGKTCYGNWNLFIMKLFYEVVINVEKINDMQDGEIIFPNPDYVKSAIEHKKFEIADKNQYKLFGTMNMFDFLPDFVYPVFENNGKYYFQNSDNSIEIDSFYEICGEEHINRIRPLASSFNKLINVKEHYTVGDEPLVAFQTSEENYFIGTSDVFNEFIKDIKIENQILSKTITDFQNEIKLAKSLKKKK